MTFNLKNLELFIRVAALGAIAKAGDELGLSATNSSLRIKNLEDDIGAVLFHRSTRALSLTPDGEVFLGYAKRILNDVEDAKSALSGNPGVIKGKIRVTASATFGRMYIVPFVPEFLALYPDIEIEMDLTDRVIDIVKEGYDLAFRIGTLVSSTLLAKRIDANPVCLVASHEYLKAKGIPETPADLVNHTCLVFNPGTVWKFRDVGGKVYEVSVSGPATVNLGDAISDWVNAGLGIGMASLWHAGLDIKSGKLKPILTEYSIIPEIDIWTVRPPGRSLPARVKIFSDFMQKQILSRNSERYLTSSELQRLMAG